MLFDKIGICGSNHVFTGSFWLAALAGPPGYRDRYSSYQNTQSGDCTMKAVVSFRLKSITPDHAIVGTSIWGSPEGVELYGIATLPGYDTYFGQKSGAEHVFQLKERGLVRLNWLQPVVSEEDQEVQVVIDADGTAIPFQLEAGTPRTLSITMILGFESVDNPPFDFTVRINHGKRIKYTTQGVLNLELF